MNASIESSIEAMLNQRYVVTSGKLRVLLAHITIKQ